MMKLKERCPSCRGSGHYYVPGPEISNPCWTCHGKGWISFSMDAPDPRWARLYKQGVRFGATKKEVAS